MRLCIVISNAENGKETTKTLLINKSTNNKTYRIQTFVFVYDNK